MNTYEIKLDTELKYTCSDGSPAGEEQILLQIWQDLKRLESNFVNKLRGTGNVSGAECSLQAEDCVVKNLLEQIMIQKYGKLSNVPFPDYYEEEK